MRVDAVKKPLQHSYDGPYKIVERLLDRDFALLIKGEKVVVNIERLKSAFVKVATEEQFSSHTTPLQTVQSFQPAVT